MLTCSGYDSAGGGADEEPFGGAADTAPGAAAAGDLYGLVALKGEGCGLFLLVGQVAHGGGQFGLTGFAVEGEVVERLKVRTRDKGTVKSQFFAVCRGGACPAHGRVGGICGGGPPGGPPRGGGGRPQRELGGGGGFFWGGGGAFF